MAIIKETHPVSGMGCMACADKIEKVLAGTDGIIHAEINFGKKDLIVEYDDSIIKIGSISKIVQKLGYGLENK